MTQTTSNIPKLRFKEFFWDWEEKKFENIFLFSTGKNIKKDDSSPKFEIPCVRYWELYHMYWEVISKIINKTNLEKWELLFSKGNEILLPSAWEDPLDIGSASALTIPDVAIGRTINILKPLENNIYLQIFVSYYINQKLRKKISRLAKGSSISNVYNSDLKKLKINLPQLPEQQKIASFLSLVDEKIESIKEKKEALEEYKKGVMQKIFRNWNKGNTGPCSLRFKDENWGKFGEWEEKKLGEFLIHKSVKNKTESIDLVLSVSNKKWFISQNEQFDGYEVASKDLSNYKIVEKYNYAYNPSRINVGSIARLEKYDIWIVSPMYVVFELHKELNPIYFDNFYKTHRFKYLIKIWCSWSVRDSLNFNELEKFTFLFASLPEQQKIADFLSGIYEKIEKIGEELVGAEEFKKGLLQGMFV